MEREEAITYLNVIWNRYKAEYEIERETLDAYHMAIEALSVANLKEEFESADAEQTDKLENQPRLVERNYTTEGGGGEIYHPTRQQGEWIWRTDIPIGDGRTSAGYICSNCGKDYWHGNVFKYCPSCGARMKGGAE